MPDPRAIAAARAAFERHLTAHGDASAAELRALVGLSQPTFSRYAKVLSDELIAFGRSRATRYAWRRRLVGLPEPIPVFEVGDGARPTRPLCSLVAIQPHGFLVEWATGDPAEPFDDLPWFLHDLRPSGFLGRLLPRRHPELGLPPDIRLWSAEHVLRYLVRHGEDHVGALIVGEEALAAHLARAAAPPDLVARGERERAWPRRAAEVLGLGPAGSSAGGEQPKFLATRDDGGARVPVLVKFSPPPDNAANRRLADLLVAEHLALETLREAGLPAARSELVSAGGRVFLEVERFDRLGPARRRGVLSLEALDAQLVGQGHGRWVDAVRALVAAGAVPAALLDPVRRLEGFGRLIANTDMHFGNLAFLARGVRVEELAPAYDMGPMAFAPRQGELVDPPLRLLPPRPDEAPIAGWLLHTAGRFWARLAEEPRCEPGLRAIAREGVAQVAALRGGSVRA